MDLQELLARIQPLDEHVAEEARSRHEQLTKPPGSLGRLEELGVQLAAIYRTVKPVIRGKAIAVFAADHGVAEAGVSAYPKAVTAQMVENFLRGGAAVNALARSVDAALVVVDVGVDADFGEHPQLLAKKVRRGSKNMLEHPAMTEGEALAAIEVGIQTADALVAGGANLLAGGEMGIGNTTAAAAITAVFTGKPPQAVTGRGTGLDEVRLAHKVRVVEAALKKHCPDAARPLEVLASVGGLEIAALTGFYLAAVARRVPVMLDGFIATAAALVAAALAPAAKGYFIAAHLSAEPGHAAQLETLELAPLLALNMRLGEGSGALLAMPLAQGAARVLAEMATFAEAGVAAAQGQFSSSV
jgi:nicotinate-nucleotide--dimethylbenzimidazole phosphoribosyltransferase